MGRAAARGDGNAIAGRGLLPHRHLAAALASLLIHAAVLALVLLAKGDMPKHAAGQAHLISIEMPLRPRAAENRPKMIRPAALLQVLAASPPQHETVAAVAPPALVPTAPSTAPGVLRPEVVDAVPAASTRPAIHQEPDPAYVRLLWTRINAHRPRGGDLVGSAVVSFALDREGKLISAGVSQSSGLLLLDRAALRAVRQAAPFPPPPQKGEGVALGFSVTVNFGL